MFVLVLGLVFERPIFVSDVACFLVLACPAPKYAEITKLVQGEKTPEMCAEKFVHFAIKTPYYHCNYSNVLLLPLFRSTEIV